LGGGGGWNRGEQLSLSSHHLSSSLLPALTARAATSQQVRHVGRQLLDLGVVEALDVLEQALIILRHEIDGNALAPKPPGPADAVQVVLGLGGQVVVDDEGDLMNKEGEKEIGK